MLTVLTLVALVAVAAVAARHLQVRLRTGQVGDTTLELWRRAWPAKPLTWAQLERRILRRMVASVTSGVSGRVLVPSHLVVSLSEADDEVIGAARRAIATDLALALRKKAVDKGWTLTGGPVVELVRDPDAYDGAPRVRASFRAGPDGPAPGPVVPDATATAVEGGATTVEGPASAWALVGADGRRVPLAATVDRVTLGRAPASDLCLPDDIVSGTHAALVRRGDGWRAEDLGSRNGTYVDGRRVGPGPASALALTPGSELRLGRTGPTFTVEGAAADATQVGPVAAPAA